MSHYVIELALWMLLAYVIGCIIGWLLHTMFGRSGASNTRAAEQAAEPAPPLNAAQPAPAEPLAANPVTLMPVAAPVVDPPEPAASEPMPLAGTPRRMERPKGLEAARGGKADDLQRISGIGPKNEKILHTLGFFHFDQIAAWTSEQVAWVDDHLKFNGRIGREHWIEQAQLLAEGRDEEFHRLYGTGGKRNQDGKTEAGVLTRRT